MIAGFNYILGDGGIVLPPDPGHSDMITIKARVSSVSVPQVSTADFKYNKDVAIGSAFDDALINQYYHMFHFFNGGHSALSNETYTGLKYSDGTGKMITFKASLVVPAAGVRLIDNESNAASFSWDKMLEMFLAGFRPINHSWHHGAPTESPWNRLKEVKGAETLFYQYLQGYRPSIGTTPAAERGYQDTFQILGYLTDFTTFTENGSVPTLQGKMSPSEFLYGYHVLNRVYHGDGFDQTQVDNTIGYWNEIFGLAQNGNKKAGFIFTHGPGAWENFNATYNALKNHPQNSDRLWVPDVNEFYDYFWTKKDSIIEHKLEGDLLTLSIDQSAVRNNTRDFGMSLLLSGLQIDSIDSVVGADEVTFNTSTGLVNIYKVTNARMIDPSTDVLPAQITSVISNGNDVIITYDKAISQSKAAGYSIDGFKTQSLNGNGRFWTVTFNNPVANKFLTYKSNDGDAITIESGIKVCPYDLYPIS